ncbi:MAG: helix-turn-helix domain-containing protein [Dermatophilaceae bacterium]|nr:helix-turn-helix domain-containing protein [Dermatophilaceae bacterium]NUQ32715.1 helix-turn-helix domain-containing protein [Dermatophilaceae bacterium]
MVFFGEHAPRETKDGEDAQHVTPLESRTRSRVLHMVSADGPITAAELGRHLDLTPAAVRRHLDALVEQGAVVPHEPTGGRRGRGRPARAYVVSEMGHGALEADYDSLAVEVLRYLEANAGASAVTDFARTRVAALEQRYAARLADAGDDPSARTAVLVEALSEDGFAATARPVGAGGDGVFAGVQLCQGHCPVQHVATEFPAFCEAETDAFSRLLGVHVQRLATLAGGHHVCTTFVPTGGIARKSVDPSGVSPSTTPRTDTLTHVKEGSS